MKQFGFVFVSIFLLASFVLAAELTDPVLITSIGQSADITTAKLMFKKAGVDTLQLVVDKLATGKNVSENGGTVVLVVGASNKGLGEAKISSETEIVRAKELIAAAHKNGAKVVLMHIGGKERRGGQSEDMIKAVVGGADFFIVNTKTGGDFDGFFAKTATDGKKTIITFAKATEGITAIKGAYERAAEKAEKKADKKIKKEKKEKKEKADS